MDAPTRFATTPSPARLRTAAGMDAVTPPHNLEAEQSVLGAIMIDRDALVQISDFLKPDHFYRELHGKIFTVMLELYEKNEPIDVVSLSNRLEERKELEKIGGRAALVQLANATPTAANVKHYAQIVARKATLRRLIRASAEIAELAQSEQEDLSVVLDEAEQRLFSISQSSVKQGFVPIKGVLEEAFQRLDELHREGGKLRGLPSGFKNLDNLLAGLQKSDLVILAARPSMGKTAFALDIARHAGVKEKVPVGIFSLEMSKEQLVDRLLCSQANVNLWQLRTGKLSDAPGADDFSRIGEAMGVLAEAPIFIDDTPMLNVMELRTKARRLAAEHGIGLIIVDYLQLMSGHSLKGAENRVQEVSEISRSLKGIARELNVPVIALSQLSRAVESRSPQIPQLADLRESGSIEQDADVVMFIYREQVYKPDTERKNIAEIHVRKHRNGPIGQVDLFFDGERVSFRNLDRQHTVASDMMP